MPGGRHPDEREVERPGAPSGTRRVALLVGLAALVAVLVLVGLAVVRAGDSDGGRVAGAGPSATGPSGSTGETGEVPSTSTAGGGPSTTADRTPSTSVPATTTVPPSTTTTTLPPGPASITLAFAGDLLPHSPVNAQAARYGDAAGRPYDYTPMFAPVAPILGAADLALCHMEVPVHPPGEAVSSYPSFGAPPELVDGARSAGYDGCSTASNHSLDRGRAGIAATLDRFDQVGLLHNGTARVDAEGGGVATVYDVQGLKVAHLSWAYGFNGYAIPADAPWSVNQIDVERIRTAAAKARADGADLVVISLHWGTEYAHDPSAYQRDVAGQLLPSPDIDLIVGHHAHVVQPIEQVEGTYVLFGLGNQLSNQTQLPRRDGLTAIVTATRGADGRYGVSGVEAVPTYVELGTFRVLPVVATLADPATPGGLRAELSASYDRTAEVLGRPGTVGLTLAPKP